MADNINSFLKKENIVMIWDVISEEEIFKFLSRDIQSQISDMFINNIKGFFEVEKNKTNNLVDINKKYILLILNYIKNTFPENLPSKIKIFNEEPVLKELITYEEIQNEKKTQFEKDFNKLQKEFTNSMSLQVPEKPEFADNYTDSPISEMDKIIKEMTAKRNYDIEQINRNYQTNITQPDNWLKSQETSVKAKKLNSGFQLETKKNVTWNKNEEIIRENITEENNNEFKDIQDIQELENNLFNKLKKVNNNPNQNIHFSIEEPLSLESPLSLEERIKKIEHIVESYNNKFDLLFFMWDSSTTLFFQLIIDSLLAPIFQFCWKNL